MIHLTSSEQALAVVNDVITKQEKKPYKAEGRVS